MTREEIIEMAREANIKQAIETPHLLMVHELERFATLVAAAERKACALICDDIETDRWALFKGREPYTGKEADRGSNYVQGESDGAGKCADAIRARSNT
jgi:hypothetical protein